MSKKVLTPEQAEVKAIKKSYAATKRNSFIAVLLAIVLVAGLLVIGNTTAKKMNGNAGTATDSTSSENKVVPGGSVEEAPIYDEEGNLVAGVDGDGNPPQELSDNPAEWTKAQIVAFYRKAAQNSTGVKSTQTMAMNNGMNVKLNSSALEFLIDLAEPIIKTVLKNNTLEFDGITGGYNSLVPSDVQTAKAYKEGDYTIIEMVMVEQTDDAYGDTFKGTVGHGISVVGNIAVVADQFPDWTINFKDAFVELKYVNPVIKVRINQNGIIEKGTWSYVVNVKVQNLQIESVIVEDATTEIDYVIKTGGGF